MKKTYRIEVDCPQCAQKAQDALCQVDGIEDAAVNFLTQKAIITFADQDDPKILKKAARMLSKVDDDIELYF